MDYRALTVFTGKETFSAYRQQEGRIDLLLLYLMMPGMNADEAFRQLKSIDPRPGHPHDRVQRRNRFAEPLSPGFDAFLKSLSRSMN
jgi:CheY-like chemotaxis protein